MENSLNKKFESIDEYMNSLTPENRVAAEKVRDLIKNLIPAAKEVISYNMPAFKLNKIVVYYAANKNHLGFYPMPAAINAFKAELEDYKTSKGAIQFSYNKPLPIDFIEKIVRFRIEEIRH